MHYFSCIQGLFTLMVLKTRRYFYCAPEKMSVTLSHSHHTLKSFSERDDAMIMTLSHMFLTYIILYCRKGIDNFPEREYLLLDIHSS